MWVKLDDDFFDHPKSRAAGKDGRELFLACLCHSAKWLLNGRIADHDMPMIAAKADVRLGPTASRLVELGRLHREAHTCASCEPCPPGHYLIHQYLLYQRDAEEERRRREEIAVKRSEAGRKGAEARWGTANANGADGNRMANANGADGKPIALSQSLSTSSKSVSPTVSGEDGRTNLPDGLWQAVAERKAKVFLDGGGTIKNRPNWFATVRVKSANELGERASSLVASYDLSLNDLADILVNGNTPAWLNGCRRTPEAS